MPLRRAYHPYRLSILRPFWAAFRDVFRAIGRGILAAVDYGGRGLHVIFYRDIETPEPSGEPPTVFTTQPADPAAMSPFRYVRILGGGGTPELPWLKIGHVYLVIREGVDGAPIVADPAKTGFTARLASYGTILSPTNVGWCAADNEVTTS